MIDRIPNWLRWALLVPGSIVAAFLATSAISFVARGVFTYPGAFVSGAGYALVALYTAFHLAPSRRRVVAAVLGMFILGDLAFVHLFMPPDFAAAGTGGGLDPLLILLRADDFQGIAYGGAVKVFGAAIGVVLAWRLTWSATKRGPAT